MDLSGSWSYLKFRKLTPLSMVPAPRKRNSKIFDTGSTAQKGTQVRFFVCSVYLGHGQDDSMLVPNIEIPNKIGLKSTSSRLFVCSGLFRTWSRKVGIFKVQADPGRQRLGLAFFFNLIQSIQKICWKLTLTQKISLGIPILGTNIEPSRPGPK